MATGRNGRDRPGRGVRFVLSVIVGLVVLGIYHVSPPIVSGRGEAVDVSFTFQRKKGSNSAQLRFPHYGFQAKGAHAAQFQKVDTTARHRRYFLECLGQDNRPMVLAEATMDESRSRAALRIQSRVPFRLHCKSWCSGRVLIKHDGRLWQAGKRFGAGTHDIALVLRKRNTGPTDRGALASAAR